MNSAAPPSPYRDGTLLALPPRLDAATAAKVEVALEAAARAPGPVYLDLHPVEGVDSAGLNLLLAWHRRLLTARRRLVLVGAAPWHRKLFEITRLDRDLHLEEGEEGREVA